MKEKRELFSELKEGFEALKEGRKKLNKERKRPEFTFEELFFMLDVSPLKAGVMFACMIHNIHHYTQYVACKTILSKWKTKDYADKPLRKKLKLYIKWLQSEMSKLESSK